MLSFVLVGFLNIFNGIPLFTDQGQTSGRV